MKTERAACAEANSQASPKWVAKLDDRVLPMPDRLVSEAVLRAQGGVPDNHLIVRDHNDPNDPVIPLGAPIDLAEGSVFYSVTKCEVEQDPGKCPAPAKHVLTVNDRPETVVRLQQSGQSIRDLFGLDSKVALFRDLESPNDRRINPGDQVDLGEGNVFISRCCDRASLEIATPRGMLKELFDHATTVAQVIERVVKEKKLPAGDLFELVWCGKVLGKNQTLAHLSIWCFAELDLVATGSGV